MSDLGLRLQQARKRAALSLRALAKRVQLSHAAIKKYEDGHAAPSPDKLLQLAKELDVPLEYFSRPLNVSLHTIKFRKRKNLSQASIAAIKATVTEQIEQRLELENLFPIYPLPRFALPPKMPKNIHNLEAAEQLAERLREFWQLGLGPLHGLIDTVEAKGVRVFLVDSDVSHFDGLATTVFAEPIIVISSKWPGCRQRFTIAHELAHSLLLERLDPSLDEELACNRFAGAFLLPKEAALQLFGKTRHLIEWQELAFVKKRFQMSMGAICHRLLDLQIIEAATYKSLTQHMRKKGWHLKEPGEEIPPEKSHAIAQLAFRALGEGFLSEEKAAEFLSCSLPQLQDLRKLVFTKSQDDLPDR